MKYSSRLLKKTYLRFYHFFHFHFHFFHFVIKYKANRRSEIVKILLDHSVKTTDVNLYTI